MKNKEWSKFDYITKEILYNDYYVNYLSYARLAKKHNTCLSIIQKLMKKYCLKARTQSEAIKGKNHFFYGKHHTKETKERISKTNKIKDLHPPWELSPCFKKGYRRIDVFGEESDKKIRLATIKSNKEREVSLETREKMRLVKLGKNNWNWKDGTSLEKYPKEFRRIRKTILERDNYICQFCYKKGNTVHHIDYNKQNNILLNLITLCLRCNIRANYDRIGYSDFFYKKNRGILSFFYYN